MAHFASLDENNVILQVVVVGNDDINNLPFPQSEPVGIEFLEKIIPGQRWAQTSYNGNFRCRFAGIGYTFHPQSTATPYGGFAEPKVYSDWVWDDSVCNWVPPVPYPADGEVYYWDEQIHNWVLIPTPKPVPTTIIGE